MASVKEKLAIGASAALLTTGLIAGFQPPSDNTGSKSASSAQTSQQVDQLSDADQAEKDRYVLRGETHEDAQIAQKSIPGEYRPRVPDLHLRVFP
jgi:hypothetical protein